MQAAIMQQTQALSVLMSHVLSQADGGLADLASGSGSSSSLASREAAKREQLQQALSSRTGNFFLQVMQQVSRRLNPASAAPQSLAELQGSPMMCRYLERFGGYAGQREAGYLMWMLAHVADALLQDDVPGAREHLALCLVCLDQSVLDGGRWDLAYMMSLLDEPPGQMFLPRQTAANPRSRAFSPLSPVGWATTSLQYLKEIDLINTRRLESLGGSARNPSSPPTADASQDPANKPPRRPRFPRKPKNETGAASK